MARTSTTYEAWSNSPANYLKPIDEFYATGEIKSGSPRTSRQDSGSRIHVDFIEYIFEGLYEDYRAIVDGVKCQRRIRNERLDHGLWI